MQIKPLEILSKYYGYTSFRKGQIEIINSILNNKDTLAIMPTGGGKSVCYQIPAMILEGITIVISPLISLMKDQVDYLKSMGIESAYINSSLNKSDYNQIIVGINDDRYKIIYVAPERLESYDFIQAISSKKISQIAIDEAHCVSQWGHDFRPSYARVSSFIRSLNKKPIITAFTATASEKVKEDIINLLGLKNPDIYINGFDRENLKINIVKSSSKNKYLLEYIENHKKQSGIIYVATRKDVDKIYEGLLKRNISVSKYHAGLSQRERNENQENFIDDKIDVMVATNAFGMGIDKPNVRWVIHYNMPQSIENYYQEIGRAGRDGESSECILLFAPGDIHIQKYLIDIGIENIDRKKNNLEKLKDMTNLVYSNSCYRNIILKYFGEEKAHPCGNCSNCLSEGEIIDKTVDAQKVISCIARMKRPYGVGMIVDVLRGSKNKKVLDLKFNEISTYGLMKKYSSEELKTFINTLVSHGFLELVETVGYSGSYPTIRLNDISKQVLTNDVKVEFKEVIISKNNNTNNELYELLKELRYDIAQEEKVAPYMVFGDGTLKDMCILYPTSKQDMISISGIGEIKYQKYGDRFEEVIKKYMIKNDIDKKIIVDKDVTLAKVDFEDETHFWVNTDEELYNQLKMYRDKCANREKVLPYMIFTANTLKEISGRYPGNEEQLNDIGGIGKVKISKYGQEILEIVSQYILEKEITPVWKEKKKLKLILDGESRKTNEIILDMLNQGQDIEVICKSMEVSISTGLGYVYDYIKEGNNINFNMDLEKFYTEDDKELIDEVCHKIGNEKISLIKKQLPDTIKYETIRAVILDELLTKS